MVRLVVIALLITVGFSSCNSIRYSSYNRPFDFVKLQHNNWKSNVKPQQADTLRAITSPLVKATEIIAPVITNYQSDNKSDPKIIKSDSSFNSVSEPFHKHPPTLYRTEKHIQFDKGNVSEYKQQNKTQATRTVTNGTWGNFLLMLLLLFIALIIVGLIFTLLSYTPTGQFILAIIIIVLVIVGLVAAIVYNNTIIFDILELLLIFI